MANLDPNNWNPSLQDNFALRSGILLVAEVASVSFIAVTVLFVISIRHAIKHYRLYGGWGAEDSPLQPFGRENTAKPSLTRSSSIQAMGNILNARWAFNGKITEGSYCTTQAILKQIGNDGMSCFTIAIAVMTFVQTMFPGRLNRSQARRLAIAMIVLIFLFLFLMIIIPATTLPHYYGNTGFKIASEYVYFWLAAAISFVLYGIIVVNWLGEATAKGDPVASARQYLWDGTVILALTRSIQGRKPQRRFLILATTCIASSGAVNVLLWLLTGRRFGFSDPQGGCFLLLRGLAFSYGDAGWGVALCPADPP
ncbi:hypothetical protein BS47DRAFT_1361789 [Hydnum rufescens UP504]|uniref:Uncharacterized protein n=1 Tax=Hydnum rufescens UP504 TaxID=1448309 RepID=A0A9P6B0T0_9AGAM|nr:hypothetical protein BS47DRAFT_1361789 [Hydnum rufescens UP504]